MKLDKARKRDNARRKARHGMRVNGKSVFLIQEVQIKRGQNEREQNRNGSGA
jgi:hypothetical protein